MILGLKILLFEKAHTRIYISLSRVRTFRIQGDFSPINSAFGQVATQSSVLGPLPGVLTRFYISRFHTYLLNSVCSFPMRFPLRLVAAQLLISGRWPGVPTSSKRPRLHTYLLNSACFITMRFAFGLVAGLSVILGRYSIGAYLTLRLLHIRTFSAHCLPGSERSFAVGTVLY